jgi:hypothetical protein
MNKTAAENGVLRAERISSPALKNVDGSIAAGMPAANRKAE